MNFKIGDLSLGGTNGRNGYHLQFPIGGLGKPQIRMGRGNFSGRDSGYVSSQFYAAREIIINGVYIGGTCEQAETLRKDLIDELPIRQSLDIFITTFAGTKYYTEGYVADVKDDIEDSKSGVFQITLVCPDAYLYDPGDGIDPDSGYIISPIYKEKPGGYITPYILPVQWVAGITSEIVNNDGDVEIAPEIILEGQYTNPKIINITTGRFVKLNMTTTAGDEIKIDMKNKEITLNGATVLGNRTNDSSWWTLVKGDNEISLITDSTSDEDSGWMRWRKAYQGT